DGRVAHAGVALDRLLHLFGEDLLAAGVDHLRAAAEQLQGPVRLDGGEISRYAPALALEHPEGALGLLRVLVVAGRQEARDADQSALPRSRLDPTAVLGEDGTV